MEFYNDFNLTPPAICTKRVSNDIAKCWKTTLLPPMDAYCSTLVKMKNAWEEACALLSRILARRKNSFHRIPGFRTLCKINATLCRMLRIDVVSKLQTFTGGPLQITCHGDNDVPTRERLEFLMIHLRVAYKNYERIKILTIQATSYFTKMLKTNHYFDICTLLISILSKIYTFSSLAFSKTADLLNILQSNAKIFPVRKPDKFIPSEFLLLDLVDTNENDNCTSGNNSNSFESNMVNKSVGMEKVKPKKLKRIDIGIEIKRKP